MNLIKYIRKNGLMNTIKVAYQFKFQIILEKIMLQMYKKKPLKNVIMIESHNDFDSNGGAFYQYLIENNYNKKYKIVWQLKNKLKKELPENVDYVMINKPGIKRAYYKCISKVLTYDCYIDKKLRKDQKLIYFTHGPICLKNCAKELNPPESLDYYLSSSDFYAPISANLLGLPYPNKKELFLGYPMYDIFYKNTTGELKKITSINYNKVILWMPTFRKGGGYRRNDSTLNQNLGIPIFQTQDEVKELNKLLKQKNVLLIIKIHPMQDISDLKIKNESNIVVLTGDIVKELEIDNYRLMKETDAMISDYSSAAYDYLFTGKPIAYDFSDIEFYKLGLVVDDYKSMTAGPVIRNQKDFIEFIDNVSKEIDNYSDERKKLFDKLYKYHDGNSCKRIVEFLNL